MKPAEQHHIQVATNLRGPVRRETLMGREYVVASAVLVRSQVLHNNLGRTLLEAADVTPEWAALANHAPAVTDHESPTARTPEVLNARGVGFVYRSRAENGALKADVFVDPTRADEVEGLSAILARLEEGSPVEVSTGFPVDVEERAGVHNGRRFDRVVHPRGFDHLAVFAEKVGACSVEDGCGLAQNAADGCACNDDPAPAPSAPPDSPPPPEDTADADPRWLMRAARALGFWPFGANETDRDRREALEALGRERFGGRGVDVFVDSVSIDDGTVVFGIVSDEGQTSELVRVAFEQSEDGSVTLGKDAARVRRTTTFVPVAENGGDDNHPAPGERDTMNRDQMTALLADGGTDRDALAKLSECQLRALVANAGGPGSEPGPGDARPEIAELQERIVALRREKEELDAATREARNAEMKERLRLQEDLIYNGHTQFSDDEIRAMDVRVLRQLHGTVFRDRVDYSGRGAPAAANVRSGFDFVRGIMDGPVGSSVLDPKESH